jgi:hypothetical protein
LEVVDDDTDLVDDGGDNNTAITKYDSGDDGSSGSGGRSNNVKKRSMVDDGKIDSSVDVDSMDVVIEVVEENEVKRMRKD